LLRRAHAHHRDLRTADAAARAAPRSRSDRGVVVTRRGLILLYVEAMPLRRMTGCASVAHGTATGGPIRRTQARLQRQSARISDRSGHAEQRRANENTQAGAHEILEYP
jgi:hypothetical protein